MPRPYPREFRDDVVRVARNRDDGVTIEQVATDFGVHPMTLSKWMRQADVDDGAEARCQHRSVCGTAGAAPPESVVRAGERSPATGRGVSVAGESAGKRLYPLVSELAADGIPVAVTCRVLKLARQPYYRWRAARVTDAEITQAYRANALFDAHRDDPEFGYRFLAEEAREAGEPMAERTAWRICSQHRLWSAFGKKKRGKNRKVGPPVHDDVVRPGFHRRRTKQVVAGRYYRAFHPGGQALPLRGQGRILQPHRRVLHGLADEITTGDHRTYQRGDSPRRGGRLHPAHRPRIPQFRSRKFVHALHRHDMVGSMGRVGAAGDNAAMESFFSLLQKNVLDRRRWDTREELRIAIVTWIERTYHRRRRQAALGRLTPIEYEAIMTTPASQAA